jgi:hypothetical protein
MPWVGIKLLLTLEIWDFDEAKLKLFLSYDKLYDEFVLDDVYNDNKDLDEAPQWRKNYKNRIIAI